MTWNQLYSRIAGTSGKRMINEIDQTFESLGEWLAWAKENPTAFDKDLRDALGKRILANGLVEPITRRVARPQDIQDLNGNWREGLAFDGISSRVRAVMRAMETVVDTNDVWNLRIYAAEGLTTFALRMRGQFRNIWDRKIPTTR